MAPSSRDLHTLEDVSPRYNRRRADEPGEIGPGAYGGPVETVVWSGEDWIARRVTGAAATKAYRCPGCDQEIRPATPHVVAWPAESGQGLEDRRHWHTGCWDARERRRPHRR